jgi:hypothetical protein
VPQRSQLIILFAPNFHVLEKNKNEDLTGKQQVDIFLRGIRSTDTSIQLAKVNVIQDFWGNFDRPAEFLSSLIANLHASVQLNYANRHAGNERRDKSAMGSNDQRGGRCRARQGNGRLASEAVNAVALVANVAHSPTTLIVPIPTKIFTPDEWE